MLILALMAVGVLIGMKWFPLEHSKKNATFQIICTALLIFCMGVKLGARPNLLRELATIGWQSAIFSLIPIATSVLVVYFLTRKFMQSPSEKEDE